MPPFQKGNPGGPGRPRKEHKFAGPIAAAEQQIVDRLPDLIERMFELAEGITVQEVDKKTGGLKVYSRPPDREAARYLIDRILGKPTERQEISGPDGEPIELNGAALDQAARELAEWRAQQIATLSSTPSSSPILPTPATPTE